MTTTTTDGITIDGRITTTKSIKAVCFDFMGTCLDWHSTIVSALPTSIPPSTRSQFALEWRQTYFDANAAKIRDGLPVEDIDVTHLHTLDALLEHDKYSHLKSHFDADKDSKSTAVDAWHCQKAWKDVRPAMEKLKMLGRPETRTKTDTNKNVSNKPLELFVYANGTTRLQLDLVRSAGLSGQFDMLFSSELLGVYKPAPESYQKVLGLLKLEPHEIVMVAAHAYDVRGAKEAGFRTVYVYRSTDDIEEDQEVIKTEFDAYLDDGQGMRDLDQVIARL